VYPNQPFPGLVPTGQVQAINLWGPRNQVLHT